MRRLTCYLLTAAVFCVTTGVTQALIAAQPDAAADYPNKPIRFIAPFVAGAGTDTTARTIAAKLGERWGQQVVVDNRTGAAGAIGVDLTAHAISDGYTICLISASHAVNSAVNPNLPYDLTKDLHARHTRDRLPLLTTAMTRTVGSLRARGIRVILVAPGGETQSYRAGHKASGEHSENWQRRGNERKPQLWSRDQSKRISHSRSRIEYAIADLFTDGSQVFRARRAI